MGLRGAFDGFRGWVGFAAATLLMVAAGRFAAGAVSDSAGDTFDFLRPLRDQSQEPDPSFLSRPVDSMSALDGGVAESEIPPELRKLMGQKGEDSGKGGKKKPGRAMASLIVNVGPERSEVFVNGVPVGRTPYLGDLQCARGNKVKVDILPPNKGKPLTRTVECRSGVLTIDY